MTTPTDHINLLGLRATDRVTGLTGVITCITFDLYGCIQALLHPGLDANGELRSQTYFDINRLGLLDAPRAMPVPTFDLAPATVAAGNKGPAEHPPIGKA